MNVKTTMESTPPLNVFEMDTDVNKDAAAMTTSPSPQSSAAREILAATPRLAQVQRFAAALEELIENSDDLRLLFVALGAIATADLVLSCVEPKTYEGKHKDVDVGVTIADCVRVVARGLRVLGVKDLVWLVNKWVEADTFNRFLASDIFATAESALATAFASAAIDRCLESATNISAARALAASASHVLSIVPGVDLFPVFVSLLKSSSRYDAFVSLALGGETEIPLLADMARNPSSVEATIDHREFGRVQQLLTSARICLQSRLHEMPLDLLSGLELAEEYEHMLNDVDASEERLTAVESEVEQRIEFITLPSGPGLIHFFGLRRGFGPHYAFNANLTANVTEKLLHNVSQGKKPFESDDQNGNDVYWFESISVEELSAGRSTWTSIPVEIVDEKPSFTIGQDELAATYEEQKSLVMTELEEKHHSKRGDGHQCRMDVISWCAGQIAERETWKFVGSKVTASEEGIALLELQAPPFDNVNGKFIIVRDPSDVHVPDAVPTLIETLVRHGMEAEPYVLKAASVLFETMKEAGQVRAAFQIGGRVLLVLKLAKDTYKVVTAKNKVKASVEVVGGWAGAAAAGSTFAHFFVPAHLMGGPAGLVAHGLGTVLAGAFGYWVGTSVCIWAYHLVVVESNEDEKQELIKE